jgi:hypothetical protein
MEEGSGKNPDRWRGWIGANPAQAFRYGMANTRWMLVRLPLRSSANCASWQSAIKRRLGSRCFHRGIVPGECSAAVQEIAEMA